MLSISARRISQIITIVALLALAAINQFGQRLTWTCDEAMYSYCAAAFSANQRFEVTDQRRWFAILAAVGLPPYMAVARGQRRHSRRG